MAVNDRRYGGCGRGRAANGRPYGRCGRAARGVEDAAPYGGKVPFLSFRAQREIRSLILDP